MLAMLSALCHVCAYAKRHRAALRWACLHEQEDDIDADMTCWRKLLKKS